MKNLIITSIILIVIAFSSSGLAQTPQKINYQAVVRDVSGNVIANKNVSLRISILRGSAFGTYDYVETHSPTTNQFGLVNLTIGEGTPQTGNLSTIDWSVGPYYIKIDMDALGGDTFTEMGTTQLVSVPYSFYSENSKLSKTAENVLNVEYSQITNQPDLSIYLPTAISAKWDKDSTNDVTLKDNQKIEGKKTFGDSLLVNSTVKASVDVFNGMAIFGENKSTTGLSYGIYGKVNSENGFGVYGRGPHLGIYGFASLTTGVQYGVYGYAQSDDGYGIYGNNPSGIGVGGYAPGSTGKGVSGYAPHTNGANYGVFGQSNSINGYGVFGKNISSTGKAVYGEATSESGVNYGIYGKSNSSSGFGVYGFNSSTDGNTYGIYGTIVSPNGKAVYGYANSVTGSTYGVYGVSNSLSGCGVFGSATNPTGVVHGVYGVTSSTSGKGVGGIATSETGNSMGVYGSCKSTEGVGVYGLAYSLTGVCYGVKGYSSSPSGFDFYAFGPGTNYGSSSSGRWKKDIVPITGVLDKVKNLQGIYFTWDQEHGGKHDLGFVGEEVAKYFPEIVVNDPEAPGYIIGMDYGMMTPILLQAINEQQVIIETQNKQIQDLLKRVEALETK